MPKKPSVEEKLEAILKGMEEQQIRREVRFSAIVGLVVYSLGIFPSFFPSNIWIRICLWLVGLGLLLFALIYPRRFFCLFNRIKRLLTRTGFDFVPREK